MSLRYSRSGSENRPGDGEPYDDQVPGDEVPGDPGDAVTDGQVPGVPAEEDHRSFTTGTGSMVDPADDETVPPTLPTFTAKPGGPVTAVVPEPALPPDDTAVRPAFEPAFEPDDDVAADRTIPDAPAFAPDDGAPTEAGVMPGAGPVAGAGPVPPADVVPAPGTAPVFTPAHAADLAAPDGDGGMRPQPLPATPGLDEPLLADADGFRTRWQRAQAGFVDDPREAVGEAADLIEQTVQAMLGGVRQRQQQLRTMWEGDPAGDAVPAGDGLAARRQDTEHLRQMMMHYRALFNQLCRP